MESLRKSLLVTTAFAASLALALSLASPSLTVAQEANAENITKHASDKTGTNPINSQRDLRVYNEYLWLNTAGDGSQNVTAVECRQSILDGAWQFRGRIRYTDLEADLCSLIRPGRAAGVADATKKYRL